MQGIEVVAINDLTSPAVLAHLLKYDSAQGRFNETVTSTENSIIVSGHEVKIYAQKDPAQIPWGSHSVDVVIESTGFFADADKAKAHIAAGAKKVVISAPATGELKTVVFNVNHSILDGTETIISCASCTTNCLAPMAKALNDNFTILAGSMTTIHAYTNDQNVADQIHSDPRRARAAGCNIIPSSTGAAKAIGLVIPAMAGKLDGTALRVPVPDGSITDLTVQLKREVTVEEVNAAFKTAAHGVLKGVLEYTEDPIVSSDIIDNPHSCIFDALSTLVSPKGKGTTVKVFGWYDNEWGYSVRTADLAVKLTKLLK
jgi:glyceraldehyde 3-phosphate dehydrogenase